MQSTNSGHDIDDIQRTENTQNTAERDSGGGATLGGSGFEAAQLFGPLKNPD